MDFVNLCDRVRCILYTNNNIRGYELRMKIYLFFNYTVWFLVSSPQPNEKEQTEKNNDTKYENEENAHKQSSKSKTSKMAIISRLSRRSKVKQDQNCFFFYQNHLIYYYL